MINNLRIQNIALIDQVEVTFAPGLNVLTGETGAGKSIIVDSINFLLGGRPGRDFVRNGADFAKVEGLVEFDDPIIAEGLFALGIDAEDGQLMLERSVNVGSKSVCRINGRTVPVSLLKAVASTLVDVHGQHEHQSLLDPVKQMGLLDQFCGQDRAETPFMSHKNTLSSLLGQYREIVRALKALTGTGNQRQEQIDIWRFQLAEIDHANIKPDEEETLTAKRNRLSGLEKLSRNAGQALQLLHSGEGGGAFESAAEQRAATDQIARAAIMLAEIAKIDPAKQHLYTNIQEISATLADITLELGSYLSDLDADPAELEVIEDRLNTIYTIKKKYGATIHDVLAKQSELTKNLDSLEDSEAEIKRLQAQRRHIITEITAVCNEINHIRTTTAENIAAGVTGILKELGMQNARFYIDITRKTAFSPDGNDAVEFMISPNPGEPTKPLRRIASGGEMSRVMLAIKTVLADADRTPSVIFDEVDTGISGRTAQQVAEKLMTISRRRQILCITHLPQIAAMADTHFLIEKHTLSERTATNVFPLQNEAMHEELARLIGGAQITAATLQAAREMKELADGLKGY